MCSHIMGHIQAATQISHYKQYLLHSYLLRDRNLEPEHSTDCLIPGELLSISASSVIVGEYQRPRCITFSNWRSLVLLICGTAFAVGLAS